MKGKLAAAGTLIATVLILKKAVKAMAIIPIAHQGMAVAAQGGDFSPYIVQMIGLLIAITLPMGIIGILLDD